MRGLADQFAIKKEPATSEKVTYLDTFDWRLFNKSLVLYAIGNRLILEDLTNGKSLYQADVASLPVFLRDFPDSELKKQLAPIIKMRALLKLAELYSKLTPYRTLDRNDKTVAQIAYEEVRQSRNKNAPLLATYLWLKPIRGYPKYSRDLVGHFVASGLKRLKKEDLFFTATAVVKKKPGSYSTKVNIKLAPEMRSDEATKAILHFLLQVMKTNQANLEKDFDTEILHDYRVAVRRTRSALGQVKSIFPERATRRFKKDFAFVGKLSNELRDLDVYLLAEDDYKAMLPPVLHDDIRPLFDYLQKKRATSFQSVLRSFKSKKYTGIIRDWETFLNKPNPDSPTALNAQLPVKDLARNRIYKKYRGVVKTGRLILQHTEDEMLHALRIECKKLRYLVEFFSGLFAPKELNSLIGQLKKLQDNLGDFNDLSVQVSYLQSIAQEFSETDRQSKQTLVAIGALIGAMDRKRQTVKEAFAETFNNFASPANHERFQNLFAPESKL